ncbi:GNAT family N-acetyltransferase [Streptomyces sp. SL13]|uniref:GNAT family N-acetyltransferase n=1 Tax=Streptantibioticus silvisoli TaxID=2705255 RepID=A0AA90KEE1_9ACTN|nr:GNAT family N-acetyltransferase [Streptantibioticus silvisoli]MDI5962408.1 GNAT family N-acetyltransferase [Streptantibioticus silvisoli]MDI5967920.1 GNAT family N-acetyltransferase [Streptantibioticus silvisoli]
MAEERRTTIINYVIALVALARKTGIDPRSLAGWLNRQYEDAGWYGQFVSDHGPGNLPAFAEEFMRGRRLLHDRTSATLADGELTVRTDQFARRDFSACFFLGIEQEDVEEFFDAVVELHARRIGIDARLSRDATHEILSARPREQPAPATADPGQRVEPAVREAGAADLPWIREVLTERWGSPVMVLTGQATDLLTCPALIASSDGRDAGLLTYRVADGACEIMSLDALEPMQGMGGALVAALRQRADGEGWRRVTVTTTNDNIAALTFYQRLGFRITSVVPDAVALSRKIKPSIPRVADNGLPITDEISLECS